MPGRAKSDAQKRREHSDEREQVMQRAITAYDAEQKKPNSEPRQGLRSVCRQVESLHHEETGRWVRIDHTTVSRRWKGGLSIREFNETKWLVTREEADALIAYTIETAHRGFPLDYRRLAEHANELIRARLGPDFPGVGVNWPERFVERHSDQLDMYWSAALDSQRGRAVNPTANAAYWKLAHGIIIGKPVKPKNTYASDEVAFNTSLHTRHRVIGPRKKVASVQHQQTGGNRENITVLDTVSGDGRSLPPAVIYKGQHFLVKWDQNNPLKASLGYSQKGWMTGEISTEWIKHFDAQTRAVADGEDRLLLVDGHVTHYTRGFLEYAKANRIHVLCYPAHATHVYQGLDVVLFGPLKNAFSEERERWERERHVQVSKANFLEVYTRAHQRVMTPDNIRAAFRKTGICPFNPSVVTTAMMAPSRETSSHAHMPLPQPTPVRVLANMLRLRDDPTAAEPAATAGGSSNMQSGSLTPPDNGAAPPASPMSESRTSAPPPTPPAFPIDPVLFTTPYRRGTAPAPARSLAPSPSPTREPQHRAARAPDPTPRTALRTTSASFIVQPEALTSDMRLPRPRPVVPAVWDMPLDLLDQSPQTEREARLQEVLRTAAEVHDQQLAACYTANATMVLQASYCERVRGQLAAAERKSRKSKSQKLMGDGMPHLLTGDDFVARVQEHHGAQARAAEEKRERAAERARYQVAVDQWKQSDNARKVRNERLVSAYKTRVAEWEAARALAKLENRRFGVKKPVRGPLEKALPKPRARTLPDIEENDMEDFGNELDELDGGGSDDE